MYEAGVQTHPEPTRPGRPREVKTLTVLLVVFGGLGILTTFFLSSIVSDSADHGQSVSTVLYALVYVQFALSAALTTSGIFVWQGRSWARVLAVVLCSVNILGALVSLFTGAILQAFTGFAINVGLLRLLNNYDVQAWCSRNSES